MEKVHMQFAPILQELVLQASLPDPIFEMIDCNGRHVCHITIVLKTPQFGKPEPTTIVGNITYDASEAKNSAAKAAARAICLANNLEIVDFNHKALCDLREEIEEVKKSSDNLRNEMNDVILLFNLAEDKRRKIKRKYESLKVAYNKLKAQIEGQNNNETVIFETTDGSSSNNQSESEPSEDSEHE